MTAGCWKPGTPEQKFNRKIRSDRLLKVLFDTIHDQENRLWALESKPPLAQSQALTALRQRYML